MKNVENSQMCGQPSEYSKFSMPRNGEPEPNNIVETLRAKVQQAKQTIQKHLYDLNRKATVFVDLGGWTIDFKHKLVYQIKNYDIKVVFEKPNEYMVRREALDGRITYVIISNNLLDYDSNIQFLRGIGQDGLLKTNERINLHEQKSKLAEKSNDIDANFKIHQAITTQNRGRRIAALLKPAAKKLEEEQKSRSPEKYIQGRQRSRSPTNNANFLDFDRLNDLFFVLLKNQPMSFQNNEEFVIRQRLGIFNHGPQIMLHELLLPIDLVSFKDLLRQSKCCSIKYHLQVDKTGGVNYTLQRESTNSLFGFTKENMKNPFDKLPVKGQPLPGYLHINDETRPKLPNNYHMFQMKESHQYHYVDLPFFYPKTPYLAQTVIFWRSEIMILDQNPHLIAKFKRSAQLDIE